MLTLSEAERATGVIAVSAGNHAQGVAYHAQRMGVPAVIVMPRFTPTVKVANTRRFGAEWCWPATPSTMPRRAATSWRRSAG